MGFLWGLWYGWRAHRRHQAWKKQFMDCPAARQAPALYSRMAREYGSDVTARRYDSYRRG